MKCDAMKEKLALYVSGDLPDNEIENLRRHLEECESCRKELADLEKVYARMKESGVRMTPKPLASDFTDKVMSTLENHDETGEGDKSHRKSVMWISGLAAAAIVVIVGISVWKMARDMEQGMQNVMQIVSFNTKMSVKMSEFFKILDVPVNDPVKLRDWQPENQAGVFAVLHKPDPKAEPETFVIDYCDEVRDLAKISSYPWLKSRLKEFKTQSGSLDNMYVLVVPMPDSTPLEREKIESEIVQKFKPVFNRKRG